MTDAEVTRHIKLKKKAARLIRKIWNEQPPELVRIIEAIPPVGTYIESVQADPKGHNEYEILGVLLFMRKIAIYPFDVEVVQRYCKYYSCLPFAAQEGVTHFELTPVQTFAVANMFGLKTTNPLGETVRLTRDAYLFVPRKFAKTTFASALPPWFMLFEDYNSESYTIANSFQQAKVCFNMQRGIMQNLDPDGRHFRVNRESIFFEPSAKGIKRASKSVCLAASPRNLDGLNAELVIRDEGAQARDTATKSGADLKNVLTSSEGARKQPLNIDITTASDVVDGPFHHELKGVYLVLESAVKPPRGKASINDSLFALIFQPDVTDKDPGDPKLWAKVQPHLGITVQLDYYEKEWQRAQLSPENMLTFKTKLLNIFCINEAEVWISPTIQQRAQLTFRQGLTNGRDIEADFWQEIAALSEQHDEWFTAFAAVDLSTTGDFTAATIDIYVAPLQQHWLITHYYVPDGIRVWDEPDEEGRIVRKEAAPFDGKIHSQHPGRFLYQLWAKDGHLIITHGEQVDWTPLVDWLLEVADRPGISMQGIGYDDWKATDFVNMIVTAQGGSGGLRPIGQTPAEFTTPCMTYQRAMQTGHLFHAPNPITTYCHQNATLRKDSMGNIKPDKLHDDPGKHIDGLITSLMALKQHIEQGHRVRGNDLKH